MKKKIERIGGEIRGEQREEKKAGIIVAIEDEIERLEGVKVGELGGAK